MLLFLLALVGKWGVGTSSSWKTCRCGLGCFETPRPTAYHRASHHL